MSRNAIHDIVAATLYTLLIAIVSTVFVPPGSTLIFSFPTFVVLCIAVHAVQTAHVDEFGHLTIIVLVSMLGLSIGVGVVQTLLIRSEISIEPSGIPETVLFTVLLATVYAMLTDVGPPNASDFLTE